MPFGIEYPHLHINCSLHVWGRIQGLQIFKRNSIISIRSKVMAFLVISWSPSSLHCPHCPHVIPIVPTSSPLSPHHPCHPHIVSIAPKRSPSCPHGCGLRGLHPMLSPWSLWSPRHPCCPHVIPTSSPSSTHHPRVIPIIPIAPRRSPCGPHGCVLCGLHCLCGLHPMLSRGSRHPHIISVIPTLFPHCLEGPHIIPNPRYPLHPLPPPWGMGAPNQ